MFKKVEEKAMGDADKTQIKFLCMKTIMSEINIIYTGWDWWWLDTAEESSEFEYKTI